MQQVITRLGELGPTGAVVLVVAGLVYGLFGWRIVRYLAIADAALAALLIGMMLQDCQEDNGAIGLPAWSVTFVLLIALPWLAWRYPKWAVAAMAGAVGFLLVQVPLIDSDLPASVYILLGSLGCGLAMAMHLTLFQKTAVFVTGVQGGWFCVGAIVAAASDPRSFGALLCAAIQAHDYVFPVMAMVLSVMLISLQLADMEQTAGVNTQEESRAKC
ncbi:MAG TPA: hypothetical protein VMV94_02650 [Phycisphaerae bacterium]|nr:hypothetical protein [Phycisphaerae bacterium]